MTNDPLAALLPVLADTMKFATQALAQSTALAELLVAKGVVTQAELDGRMALGQKLRPKRCVVYVQICSEIHDLATQNRRPESVLNPAPAGSRIRKLTLPGFPFH